jgi:hypothetical protein
LAWSKLCKPLSEGGLGFRSFESFNEAMIAKLAWWVLSGCDSFYVKVVKAKYKVDSKWLLARPTKAASFTWRGLESVRHILAKGACMLVGSGQNILMWKDPWIPEFNNFLPQPRDTSCTQQSMAVADLMS